MSKLKTFFPVWLRNRLLSAGLEPVLWYTEKLCIPLYYRQFSTNIIIKIIKLITVLLALDWAPSGNKTVTFIPLLLAWALGLLGLTKEV